MGTSEDPSLHDGDTCPPKERLDWQIKLGLEDEDLASDEKGKIISK
jgi:hypothetical protein